LDGTAGQTGSPLFYGMQIANAVALVREQVFIGFDVFGVEWVRQPAVASSRFAAQPPRRAHPNRRIAKYGR
jgi:hypothetical protein